MSQLSNLIRFYKSFPLILIINLIFLNVAGAQGNREWQALPDMPEGKWEPGVINFDNKLYIFGGYKDGVVSSKRSEYFDPSDMKWTQIQEQDQPGGQHPATHHGHLTQHAYQSKQPPKHGRHQ